MRNTAKTTFTTLIAAFFLLATVLPAQAQPTGLSVQERRVLEQYAIDTWQ